MAVFEFATPTGEKYRITAPDEAAAVQAWQSQNPMPAKAPDTVAAGPQKTKTDVMADVGHSIVSGLAGGTMAIPGMLGDVPDLGAKAFNWGQGIAGVPEKDRFDPAWFQKNAPDLPRTAGIGKAVGFTPYEAKTDAGRYAGAAAAFAPSALAFGGLGGGFRGALVNAGKYGAVGGVASEGGGDLAAGAYGKEARPYGQLLGALLGPGVASKGITPFPATEARTAAVNALRNEGVTGLTAGQRTGNTALRYWESETGGPAVTDAMTTQGEQFTRAVLDRAGIGADRATPEVVDAAFTRIGNDFNQLSARNAVIPDRQFVTDMQGVVQDYGRLVNQPSQSPAIGHYLTEIGNVVGGGAGGPIAGDVYQSLRSRIAADARSAADQYTQQALNGMVNALDDAMERSITAANPADLGGFQQARQQYRAMMVVEKAATGAGAQAGESLITPAKLREATLSVYGRRNYARGGTPFDELARSGSVVMAPLPQSGTASRLAARATNAAPALVGAAVGGSAGGGDAVTTLLGGLLGSSIPAAARRVAFSPPGRTYLANQVLGGANRTPMAVALASGANNATLPARLPNGRPFDELTAALARR